MEIPRQTYYAAVILRRALRAILTYLMYVPVAVLLAPWLTAARNGLTRISPKQH
jgi:hypothetical protein